MKSQDSTKVAHDAFLAGYVAARYTLNFSPATNEGDYSGYFWAGFKAGKRIADLAKDDTSPNDYDSPNVLIERRFRK